MKKFLIPAFLAVVALANAEELKLSNYILNTTFSGDARVRYDVKNYDTNSSSQTDSDYFSTRFRLNTTTKINDNFSFGTRIKLQKSPIGNAVDSSTNKGINADISIERLYMDYKIGNNTIRVGRMGSPIYILSDMLIDTNVEGIAYSTKFNDTQLKAGYLLKNSADSTETSDENSIIYAQGVQTFKLAENKLLVEASVYLEDKGNSTSTKAQDIKAFTLGGEYTLALNNTIEMAQIKGQYITSDADNDNVGYTAGLVIGSKAIKQQGTWQVAVDYKKVEKSAFPYISNDTVLDQEVTKIAATTYVAPNTNLELAYEIHDYISSSNSTKNYDLSYVALNYTF